MKRMLKRLISGALCITTLFTLAACGKSGGSSEIGESSDGTVLIEIGDSENVSVESSGGTTASEAVSAISGGSTEDYGGATVTERVVMDSNDPFANIPKRLVGTTVTFATWGDESAEVYMKVIKAFEKKTGINVDIVTYSQDTYVQSIATQIVNKAAPDVVIADDFPNSFQITQPVQNIIDLSDDFWDAELAEMSTINGNTYFINSWTSVWESVGMVFYNKKIFDNNGVTSPGDYYAAGKWTYENYIKCAREISKLGYAGTTFDAGYFNMQNGTPALLYDIKAQKFTNNLSNAVEGYKLKQQLIQEGLDKLVDGTSFSNGSLAMYTSSIYGAKYNGYFKSMDDAALALVPLPSSYNGKELNRAVSNGARAYGIAKGAKNPEGAAYFLRYFLDYSYYEKAGANAFKNDGLKEMYFNEVVPIYKNNKNRLIEYGSPLALAGYSSDLGIDKLLKDASESQVATIIATKNNIYETAVQKTNEFIANLD